MYLTDELQTCNYLSMADKFSVLAACRDRKFFIAALKGKILPV